MTGCWAATIGAAGASAPQTQEKRMLGMMLISSQQSCRCHDAIMYMSWKNCTKCTSTSNSALCMHARQCCRIDKCRNKANLSTSTVCASAHNKLCGAAGAHPGPGREVFVAPS